MSNKIPLICGVEFEQNYKKTLFHQNITFIIVIIIINGIDYYLAARAFLCNSTWGALKRKISAYD